MKTEDFPEALLYSLEIKMDQLGNFYLDKEFHTSETIKKYFSEDTAGRLLVITEYLNKITVDIEKTVQDILT